MTKLIEAIIQVWYRASKPKKTAKKVVVSMSKNSLISRLDMH